MRTGILFLSANMIFSLKSAAFALALYANFHDFISIKTNVIVMDCEKGETVYKTHYYRYIKNKSIEFIDDKTNKIVKINPENGASFFLEAPADQLKD